MMNRPLLVAAAGGIVVVIAIALNFVLLQDEVNQPSPEKQLAAEVEAATRAAELARIEAQKALDAAQKAVLARNEAERAKAEAEQARQNLTAAQSAQSASAATGQAATADQARQNLDAARAATEKATSETALREAAAREAQKQADKAFAEAEQAKLAAQKAAKIAQAEAATSRQMARAAQEGGDAPAAAPQAANVPPVAAVAPPQVKTQPAAPTFDIVRVENDGNAVIAGRAAPRSEVVVKAGPEIVGRAVANPGGEWVLVPERPLKPGNLELGLSSRLEGREVPADSVVVIVVPDREQPKAAAPAAKPSEALAVAVPRQGGGASRVLQAGQPKAEDMQIAVDAVDYDDSGTLTISGRAPAGGILQLYLDNIFIGRTTAGGDGRWSLQPQIPVKPGLYSLRADLVDPAGTVLARVAFPFTRAESIAGLTPGTFVVVQPGNSLWRIARRTYGEGTQYHEIYAANQEQIKDPDLIYPGQVFTLPPVN